METILNLIWLSIAIGAAGVYCIRAAALAVAPDSSRRKREVALVLLCVVALLFPIISVTDDLAIYVATLDVWTAARRVSTVLITLLVVALAGCSSLDVVTVDLGRAPVRLASVGLGELPILSILSPSTETVWSFRSPPNARS